MQRFLVVATRGTLPPIPDRFQTRHVRLSGEHACVVADDSVTTEELSTLFGFAAEANTELLGVVVKMDHFSGSDIAEIINKFQELGDL